MASMSRNREESSYLPMNANPEITEKKKIIKKVRFHDDEPVVVEATPQPKVGTKRTLQRNDVLDTPDQSDNIQLEEMAEDLNKEFEAIQKKLKVDEYVEKQIPVKPKKAAAPKQKRLQLLNQLQ
jgi:hypothetical protein